jgi:putative peptide zinc metalloprotease protein
MAGNVEGLQRLREDLRLTRGGIGLDGHPLWVIHDPLTNRFFQLNFEMFQVFSQWNRAHSPEHLLSLVFDKFGRRPERTEIDAVARLCNESNFFQEPAGQDWRSYHASASRKPGWIKTLIHNYIFFKVPLFSPETFLRSCWPYVRFLFTKTFVVISLCAMAAGLFLVSREWEAFINSFPYFFTFGGVTTSILAVILVKSLHELGHGFVAHRYGCRTATMGVAFMALAPMLYSDVTDAWKLKSRHQRMMIDSAGIMVELALGMWCLLLWPFLPDGPLRSAVFVTATVSWVMSLFVNLNPMTRFDGYYILSDMLGMPNLQNRAFAHMRHKLRQLLFGATDDHAERFSSRRSLLVLVIGVVTAIYRFFLYLGIALLVYYFFIKALGILMLLAELYVFFFLPVWRELKVWWNMRNTISRNSRSYVSAALAFLAIAAFFIPLSRSVEVPALLEPELYQRLFAEAPGQITQINVENGQPFKKGETLFVIDSPGIVQQRRIAMAQLKANRLRLDRIAADAEDLSSKQELAKEAAQLVAQIEGLDEMTEKLVIKAPFDGIAMGVPPSMYPGKWISRTDQLGLLVGGSKTVARGYAGTDDAPRLRPGAQATFVPDDITKPSQDLSLTYVAASSADTIDLPALTSVNGGAIAVNPGERQELVPAKAQYPVQAESNSGTGIPPAVSRGVLRLAAAPESLAESAWRGILRVLIREAGA